MNAQCDKHATVVGRRELSVRQLTVDQRSWPVYRVEHLRLYSTMRVN